MLRDADIGVIGEHKVFDDRNWNAETQCGVGSHFDQWFEQQLQCVEERSAHIT